MIRARLSIWCNILSLLPFFLLSSIASAGEKEIVVKLVDIRGHSKIDKLGLLAKLTLQEGEPFSVSRIREEIRNLYRTGYFDRVDVETEGFEGGVALYFVVHEKPTLFDVRYEGNGKIITERLKEKVSVRMGAFVDAQEIEGYVERIKKVYEDAGFYHTAVVPVTEILSGNRATLTFLIQEGGKAHVRQIRFRGNSAFTERFLKKQIETSSYFWLTSWLTESGRYKQEEIDADLQRIRDLYLNHGYLKIQIGRPDVQMSGDRKWFEVTFNLEEGKQFKIGKIGYKGNTVFDLQRLADVTKSKEGEIFNRTEIRNDITNMVNLYGERGYIFANVVPQITPREDSATVDIAFQVTEEEAVKVAEIHISGNDKTRDQVIRREIRVNEQELVDTKLLRRSFQRLNNLNFFENIEINPRLIEKGWVDLDVKVKEKSTGTFSIGGGYSSTDKLIATMDITQGNLFGRGQLLRGKIDTGKRRETYSLTFREPYLLGEPMSGTIDLFNQVRRFSSYDEKRVGGDLSVGRSFGEYIHASVSYSRLTLDIFGVQNSAPDLIKGQAGKTLTRAVGFSLSRDTRDVIHDPKEGTRHAISLEYAGTFLGGDNDYYKATLDSSRFFPLWRNHVFSLHGRVGYADGIGGKALPAGERFFVGGINTVRGFNFGKAGPVTSKGEAFGGNKQLFFNAEYLVPLVPEANIKGLLFYDYGKAFDDSEPLDLSSLRQSAGFGIRWISPIGPLRLEWARNLTPKEGERSRMMEFSIGTLF